jgi:hypothetical protein
MSFWMIRSSSDVTLPLSLSITILQNMA